MKKLTSNQINLIAGIYAGSMLSHVDVGMDSAVSGVSDVDLNSIITAVNKLGFSILGNQKQFIDLASIVNHVTSK